MDDEEAFSSRQSSSAHIRSYSTEDDYIQKANDLETEEVPVKSHTTKAGAIEKETAPVALVSDRSRKWHGMSRNLTRLEISGKDDQVKSLSIENVLPAEDVIDATEAEPSADRKAVTSRKSFQLGKQLSCRWTTGAGPRIGCVRNYPPEIQCQALEHVNLSPRSMESSRSFFSTRTLSVLGQ